MEKKTSIFLIILLCILVAVAGGSLSWSYLNKIHDDETQTLEGQIDRLESNLSSIKNKSATLTPTPTTTPTPTIATTNPTANWNTYTGKYEGLSIKYPPTWTMTLNNQATTRDNNHPDISWIGPIDGFSLTSPDGNYIIVYTTHIDGIGGGCDEGINCPKTYYHNVFPLTSSNYTNLQLLQTEFRDQDNTTIRSRSITLWNPSLNTTKIPKTGDTIEGLFYGLYKDKGADKVLSQLGGSFKNGEIYQNLSTTQYFDLPIVKEAISILKTATFK